MRSLITGIHLEHVSGWRFSTGESHLNPGDVIEPIQINLDALGLLTSASVTYQNRPQLGPYATAIKIDILDDVEGWQEVALCRVTNPKGILGGKWSLELSPVEDIEADAFYTGFIPPISVAWDEGYNLYGAQPAVLGNYTETNQGIMSKLSSGDSGATWGVDANRRAVFGSASAGTPVAIPRAKLLGLTCEGWELNDYLTEWIEDPGEGWLKRRGHSSVSRPRYAPKKGATVTAKFEEVTGAVGAPLKSFGVLNTQPASGETPLDIGLSGSGLEIATHEGTSQVLYMVWDFDAWYRASALVKTNESSYQPLAASLEYGLRINGMTVGSSAGYPDLVFTEVAWLSSSSEIDLEAVQIWQGGLDEAPPLALSGQLAALGEDYDRSIIVPQRSSKTLEISLKRQIRLSVLDIGKVTFAKFDINQQIFTEDQAVRIGPNYLHIALAWGLEADVTVPDIFSANVSFLASSIKFKSKVLVPTD